MPEALFQKPSLVFDVDQSGLSIGTISGQNDVEYKFPLDKACQLVRYDEVMMTAPKEDFSDKKLASLGQLGIWSMKCYACPIRIDCPEFQNTIEHE